MCRKWLCSETHNFKSLHLSVVTGIKHTHLYTYVVHIFGERHRINVTIS